jgi:pyruvate/2-oxoglutarate dehydrogenase complex dihydrolipoamide acyltransferase (E2) component
MARMVLKLPKLAVSMREGVVTEWLVAAGEAVVQGQLIYTVESEKAAIDVESPFTGVFTPLVEIGETYQVGDPIAQIVT